MSQETKGKGKDMNAVFFFGAAFVLSIAGILLYMKSDDTAFNKASELVKDLRAEYSDNSMRVKKAVEDLSLNLKSFEGLCIQKMTELNDSQAKLKNHLDAVDLEIQRLKEKYHRVQVRAVPTTHTVKLEISEPVPVRAVKKEALRVDILGKGEGKKEKAKGH